MDLYKVNWIDAGARFESYVASPDLQTLKKYFNGRDSFEWEIIYTDLTILD